MNLPIMMNADNLIQIRDDLDKMINQFQSISSIGEEKQLKIKELIGKENASKVMDILFEEIIA